jgi:type IV secretion system protein VirB4
MIATLRDYGARRLGTVETPDGPYSEMLEFLGMLANGGTQAFMRTPTHSIAKYLPHKRLYFGSHAIEIRGNGKSRYAGMVSVKEYGPQTATGMLDSFLKLPFEFIMSQSFAFTNRQTSIENMRRQQNRMINAQEVAISQIAEINDALDITMSGHAGFGTHHLTIMALSENLKELDKNLSLCIAELVNVGINATREKINLEPAFWAQLPCNYEFIARKAEVNTLNLASFASLHNYPVGSIDDNHWGPAVTVFDTASGTPYFFNFHLRDVGHTTIIGPTGAGKTVLMNFLVCQAQKFNCRTFMFDKDRGCDIFIRALGGVYNQIEVGEYSGFNPLQLADTGENRAFLCEWLKVMLTTHNEPFTSEDMERVNEAVSGNFKLKKEDRMLRNIAPFLGLEIPGSIGARFRQWHSDGPYSKLFDNETDNIDFDISTVFGFEMGDILATKDTLAPTLLYLFHRINLSLDGTPTMIILDEAWALIDNPIFSKKIKDWLKTLRKLNAMVVFATQSVEDASKSTINDTLLQQTATQIFLPNAKATDEYRKAFLLSKREFQLIKETDPGSRFFLLKQGTDVVVARIDLSGMEEFVYILSGRADTVRICDDIRKQHGENPEAWVPVFKQRMKER